MKRILSMILAFAMILVVTGVPAMAGDTGPAGLSSPVGRSGGASDGEITVTVRIELKDLTLLEPIQVALDGRTYAEYGLASYSNTGEAIPEPGFQTPLHAVLEALTQQGATPDDMVYWIDVIDWGGVYLNSIYGSTNPGYYYTYAVNNMPGSVGIGAYQLEDGDSIVVSESWSSYPTPTYSAYFDRETVNTAAGNTFVLTLMGTDLAAWPTPPAAPIAGADIYVDGDPAGKVTDHSGRVALSFEEPGTYVISAQRTATTVDSDISRPYCKVVVGEAPASDDKAAVEGAIASLPYSFSVTVFTDDIPLPYTDWNTGAVISWESSDPSVVADDGRITRPAPGEEDAVVTLTATVSKGEASGVWSIEVTVPAWTAQEQEDALALVADIAALPGAEEITLAYERQVDELMLRYAALEPARQEWVTNYDLLLAAKARIDQLLEAGGEEITSSWPMLRGGDDNMAVVKAGTPESAADARLKWESWFGGKLDAYGSGYSGHPILVGDGVYVPRNHQIQQVDKATGEILKATSTSQPLGYNSYPAYGDGRIYVPLTGGRVEAFDAVSLRSLWVSESVGSSMNGLSAVLYADGVIYTGFTDYSSGCFVALDAATGSKLWSYDGPSYYWAGAAKAGDYVVFGGDDGTLVSADARTGQVAGTLGLGSSVRSAVAYADGNIYAAASAGRVARVPLAADGSFGTPVSAELGYGITATPVVYGDEVYVACYDADYGVNQGKLFVLKREDLSVKASVELPGDSQSSPLLSVGADGKVRVYVTINDSTGALVCCTWDGGSLTAETIFTPAHTNYCNRSPIADEEGTIYYSNDAGYLYAVCSDSSGSGEDSDQDGDDGSGSGNQGSGLSDYWNRDKLDSRQILAAMDNAWATGTKNIVVDMQDTLMVKGEVFTALKGMGNGYTLTLDCGTHTFTMAASQVPAEPGYLRLSLVQQNYRDDLETLLGAGSDYLALHFDHAGDFPGPMSVVLRLPSALREKTLYLSRADGQGGYLEVPGAILASGDYCLLSLTQGGDYIISTKVLGAASFIANPLTGGAPALLEAAVAGSLAALG